MDRRGLVVLDDLPDLKTDLAQRRRSNVDHFAELRIEGLRLRIFGIALLDGLRVRAANNKQKRANRDAGNRPARNCLHVTHLICRRHAKLFFHPREDCARPTLLTGAVCDLTALLVVDMDDDG